MDGCGEGLGDSNWLFNWFDGQGAGGRGFVGSAPGPRKLHRCTPGFPCHLAYLRETIHKKT